jgi:hypothetical protein
MLPLTLHIGRPYLFLSLGPQLLCKIPKFVTQLYINSQNLAGCASPTRIEGEKCSESIEVLRDAPDSVACHSTLQTFFATRIECVILCYESATQSATPRRSRYQKFFSMPLRHSSGILRPANTSSKHLSQQTLSKQAKVCPRSPHANHPESEN